MSLKALFYAYVLGGVTFIPLLILGALFYTIYTSVPVDEADASKAAAEPHAEDGEPDSDPPPTLADLNDLPSAPDASYVGLVRGFLDARSKDAKRSRPKDMWYVVLKGKVLYLYEDEAMTECEAAVELGGHDVLIYPEGLLDGELFAKRNAICLRPKAALPQKEMPSVTGEMHLEGEDIEEKVDEHGGGPKQRQTEREKLVEVERRREEAQEEALDSTTPWFIFVRSVVEMEDWYHSLVHASDHAANSPTLEPLQAVFSPADMSHLVATLDEQPDVIPMRWLNALIGRLFFSYYRTQTLESYIIGRLMKKISKVKKPGFLTDIVVREVSVGNKAPTLSKPMLKELTKEGDAALELHVHFKGEFRITVETVATIALGTFRTYTVKLVLALVFREIEGNLLVKVKRPPSSRIWYAFTQMPRVVMDVEPVVSDRQITWNMILSTIQSRVKEVFQESVVMPNMDDISFFESSQYLHRGGIWADASRREAPSSSFSTAPPPPMEDNRSTLSAPVPEVSGATSDTELPAIQRSQSEEPQTEARSLLASPEGDPVRSSTTTALTTPPSSTVSQLGNASDNSVANEASGVETDISRGRPSDMDSTITRRSSSTPSSGVGMFNDDTPRAEGGDFLSPTPDTMRRSSSQHSRSSSSREASVPASSDDESSSTGPESNSVTFRSKSPQQNGTGRATPTSPSFLQTLKSRAGDKQALSNSAKEAMRKWGVNWGSLRRESGGSPGGGNSASGGGSLGASAATEEIFDAGNVDQQRQPESRTHRVRPSYAEVRAAVEQRRASDRSPSLGTDPQQSDPIPIPSSTKGKERARSISSLQGQGDAGLSPYSGGANLSPSTSPRPNADATGASPDLRAVSSPSMLQRTDSQRSNPDGSDESEQPHRPIHTKPPQAISMTIPGIHASHRGEVMSMGYAPPAPPPAPAEQKKPVIQSVYRLWKAPNSSVSPSHGTEMPPQTQAGLVRTDQDGVSPPDTQSDAPPPSRPIPPALPPRKNSTHALLSKPEVTSVRLPDVESDAMPASAALQSIVSKDRNKRASLERPAGTRTSASPPRLDGEEPTITSPSPAAPFPKPPALPPRRAPIAQV
ncbi:hypothetical protein B0H21DRAFT_728623 [Amylocystis lapponica]|nr:hypothetical protein B0H21DRAFT_728623 [Amylocystis lapponica]